VNLRIFNSLTKTIEEFKPLNPANVTFYGCGPTVYDHVHIGNLRSFVLYDLLKRVLEFNNFQVQFIENLTDVDDKIIKRSAEMGISPSELSEKFSKVFFDDISKLNILPANNYPKATEHVSEMIKFIEVLLGKGLAYQEADGSVYFDVSKFANYGKLSGVDKSQIKSGTRILSDEYSKDDVQDFALWKMVKGSEVGWDSPWGKGRPGWHIECSVMSQQFLGDTIDIHAGGVDLLFPHHENEIAQSEGVSGKSFVRYWVHGEHLLVDGAKMSKSLGNFYTLVDIENKGIDPLALRYLFLTAHYRDKLNFTWESLTAAQNALNNLRETIRNWDQPVVGCAEHEQRFTEALDNDLNTAQALAILWELVKSDYPTSAKAGSLLKMDQVLGLGLAEFVAKKIDVPENVMELVSQREEARKNSDYHKSDQLRKQIKDLGFEVLDTLDGSKVNKIN